MTANRQLILEAISEKHEDKMPPHSVEEVHRHLTDMARYKWDGYPHLDHAPNIRNINRTCVDLLNGGWLVVSRLKRDPLAVEWLPTWEKQYQLADRVQFNYIITECNQLYNTIKTAKNGIKLFGVVQWRGLTVKEVEELSDRIEVMLQRTFEKKEYKDSVKRLKDAKAMLRSGILLTKGTS